MLIREEVLARIRSGEVTLQFRRWKRPTVRPGGTLRTKAGMLAIGSVTPVSADEVTEAEARRAGYADRAEALGWLEGREGELVRIEVAYAGADPRLALRTVPLSDAELAAIVAELDRVDAAADIGAWTGLAMELIAAHPGRLAAKLAAAAGLATPAFKSRIRKLKAMGLTESLKVGYRLSDRGRAVHTLRTGRTVYEEAADLTPPRRGSR